jgi:hypothetical protein
VANQFRESSGGFRNRGELQGLILARSPDVILLCYWELAALLPFELVQPVVLDFVAPRPLEELFENPETVRAGLRRLASRPIRNSGATKQAVSIQNIRASSDTAKARSMAPR